MASVQYILCTVHLRPVETDVGKDIVVFEWRFLNEPRNTRLDLHKNLACLHKYKTELDNPQFLSPRLLQYHHMFGFVVEFENLTPPYYP